MSMFSEIAIESTIQRCVIHVRNELKTATDPAVIKALKAVGRKCLEEFVWTTPAWAAHYEEIFRDDDPARL